MSKTNLWVISFKKTVVGWYNFSETIFKYNVNPETFRKITGVSKQATMGTCELSADQIESLKENAKYIGLAPGWEIVPSDDCAEVAN